MRNLNSVLFSFLAAAGIGSGVEMINFQARKIQVFESTTPSPASF